MVLFRLLSAQPSTDGETWKITGRFHKDVWHTDAYGQNPAPFQRNPRLSPRSGPPYPWKPGQLIYSPSDPVFSGQNTFGLSLDASSYPAQIQIYGNTPVNVAPAANTPLVPLQATTNNTGGVITPGFRVIQISANGAIGPVSNPVISVVPAGSSTNTIVISGIQWPAGVAAPSPAVYAGPHSLSMTIQASAAWTGSSPDANGNPTVITITSLDAIRTGLPDVLFSQFEVQQSQIVHGGVWGDTVTSTGGTGNKTLTFAAAAWTAGQFDGYVLSLYYRPGVTLQPAVSRTVASTTANTLTVTSVSSSPFLPGDVVVLRAAAAHISANTIGDDNFVNSYAPSGLTINAEAGNLIQIIAGTGAGMPPKPIASNTATVFTINGTWDITPDATSVYIILAPAFTPSYTTSIVSDGSTGSSLWGSFVVASGITSQIAANSLFVQVATADANGNTAPMRFQPFREIFVPSQNAGAGGSGPLDTIAVVNGTATPNLSFSNHHLVISSDTFLAAPSNMPAGASTSWVLAVDNSDTVDHSLLPDPTYSFSPALVIPAGTRAKIGWLSSQSGNSSLNFVSFNQPKTAI